VDDRHLHLLGADPVLLLADDLLDALVDRDAERQQRVDARTELADVAARSSRRCDGISASVWVRRGGS
jgi:hypothetical protein